jgi:hypothetical protein
MERAIAGARRACGCRKRCHSCDVGKSVDQATKPCLARTPRGDPRGLDARSRRRWRYILMHDAKRRKPASSVALGAADRASWSLIHWAVSPGRPGLTARVTAGAAAGLWSRCPCCRRRTAGHGGPLGTVPLLDQRFEAVAAGRHPGLADRPGLGMGGGKGGMLLSTCHVPAAGAGDADISAAPAPPATASRLVVFSRILLCLARHAVCVRARDHPAAAPARPGPAAALVGLAPPPPAPRPPSPPTLERLCRGNTMITTNGSAANLVMVTGGRFACYVRFCWSCC